MPYQTTILKTESLEGLFKMVWEGAPTIGGQFPEKVIIFRKEKVLLYAMCYIA